MYRLLRSPTRSTLCPNVIDKSRLANEMLELRDVARECRESDERRCDWPDSLVRRGPSRFAEAMTVHAFPARLATCVSPCATVRRPATAYAGRRTEATDRGTRSHPAL